MHFIHKNTLKHNNVNIKHVLRITYEYFKFIKLIFVMRFN
jgi:hypothetical protein